jgi:hypothetical protein
VVYRDDDRLRVRFCANRPVALPSRPSEGLGKRCCAHPLQGPAWNPHDITRANLLHADHVKASASLYNPYWQVRLQAPSLAANEAVHVRRGAAGGGDRHAMRSLLIIGAPAASACAVAAAAAGSLPLGRPHRADRGSGRRHGAAAVSSQRATRVLRVKFGRSPAQVSDKDLVSWRSDPTEPGGT